MSVEPIILTARIDDSKFADVIKVILEEDCISEISNETDSNNYDVTTCSIDTKYYTARVQFHQVNCATSVDGIISRIEAVVLYVDHSIESLATELNRWEAVIRDIDSDTKILLSKHLISKDQKDAVDAWCSENECELIELEFDQASNSDSISHGDEKWGIKRLIEALQTHQWSNLRLKKRAVTQNSKHGDTQNTTKFVKNNCATPTNSPIDTPPENSDCSVSTFERLDNMEDIFALFQNLNSMKLNISSLSGAEKLDEAEKVVKTFWSAIGGDMKDEFSDNDDDEIT